MKKKIVYLLCYLRMEKLARKISASYVYCWIGEQFAKGFADGFKGVTKNEG